MPSYVEHCNLTVADIDATVAFLSAALPDWSVRGEGTEWVDDVQQRWLHFGNDSSYISLNEKLRDVAYTRSRYREPGINHIGIVVDDAQGVRDRLVQAGYREIGLPAAHMHRQSVCFADPDGNEFEFIEYYSEDPTERNDYADEGLQFNPGAEPACDV